MSAFLENIESWFWPALVAGSAVAVSIVWYLLKKSRWSTPNDLTDKSTIILKDPMDVRQKSRVLAGPERIHTSIFANGEEYLVTGDPTVTTLYENFLHGLKRSDNGNCLGRRTGPDGAYEWLTYQEVLDKGHSLGAALLDLGLEAGTSYVGIYSQNRPEWFVTSLAAMSYSMVVIPLYDTLGAEAAAYIAVQADLRVIVCDGVVKLSKLRENLCQMRSLRHIVIMDWSEDVGRIAKEFLSDTLGRNVRIHSFNELVLNAVQQPPLRLPKPDDVFMVCYTSGTTGDPKGVLISHGNVVSELYSFKRIFDAYGVGFSPDDEAMMSYLPMAHMFEQIADAILMNYGAKIGFFRGNINELLGDMKALSPVCFPVVPRLLNRLYHKVQAGIACNPVKRLLFHFAYIRKFSEMRRGVVRQNSFWDKFVFGKIQRELGGRVRLMVTGSAPVAKEVLNLTRAMLGAVIFESYGQTECSAACTCTLATEIEAGHVGGVLPCCHVKLVDVPELEYFSVEDRGEICIRGANVTRGYFMDLEKTKEAFDVDGWLHTGDVGQWLPDGSLKIIDRKKHIFKLAQGEYVAPEKVENIYLRCPYVAQIFVDGNSLQRSLVAIVVPEELALKKWAADNELGHLDAKQLCARDDVKAMILENLQKTGKANGLNSLEQVKAVYLSVDQFTTENGLLTPTMKNKRPNMRKRYISRVEDMYKKMIE